MINPDISEYAVAIFELAKEQKSLKEFRQDVIDLNDVFNLEIDFFNIFVSSFVDQQIKKELVKKIFDNKINEYLLNFLLYLIDNNDTKYIRKILTKTIEYLNNDLSIINVEVYSPFKIDDKYLDLLSARIKQKTNKQPVIKLIIDTNLIGGIKVKYADILLDNSIKNKLEKIRNNMRKGDNYVKSK